MLTNNQILDYAGNFKDGAPKGWDAKVITPGEWEITLPNRRSIRISTIAKDMFWLGDFPVDSSTTRLWHNSMRYLLNMTTEDTGWKAIRYVLANYLTYLRENSGTPESLRSGSLDHQIALQLRTICTLKSLIRNDSSCPVEEKLIIETICTHIVNANIKLSSDLNLLKPHNHGIMLGTAILHACVMFPATVDALAEFNKASTFLISAFKDIIDTDGLSGENTPTYQVFYIGLIGDLSAFFEWLGEHPFELLQYNRLKQISESAFCRLLLPDNAVPAIGDSPGGPQSTYVSTPGTLFSSSNGLYIYSTEETHISIISGFRSVIHKQLDDTSIRLWHAGQHLISDAGLSSYDVNDELAVSLRSQRGHSGVYFTRFDSFLPAKVVSFGKNTSRVESQLDLSEGPLGCTQITCFSSFDKKYWVKRKLTHVSPNQIKTEDTARSIDNEPVVVRFLLDPSLNIEFHDRMLVCKGPKAWMTIEASGQESLKIYHGHHRKSPTGPITTNLLPKGFIAHKLYELQSTYLLEFTMKNTGSVAGEMGQITTIIRFGAGQYQPEGGRGIRQA